MLARSRLYIPLAAAVFVCLLLFYHRSSIPIPTSFGGAPYGDSKQDAVTVAPPGYPTEVKEDLTPPPTAPVENESSPPTPTIRYISTTLTPVASRVHRISSAHKAHKPSAKPDPVASHAPVNVEDDPTPLKKVTTALNFNTAEASRSPPQAPKPTDTTNDHKHTYIPELDDAPEEPETPVTSCADLPGAQDVFVAMKTGATESHHKVPIHFVTTFRCIPHYRIYSDMEETIDGQHIYDVLDEVPDEIKKDPERDDFNLYNEMQEHREQGKSVDDLIADNHDRAWNLDKWKFLPLMKKMYNARPQAKWFVMIEADTYLLWSNLLQWFGELDHNKKYYMGSESWIGDHIFGHGGSGVVISQPAMKALVETLDKDWHKYYELTAAEWAGDLVLAKAFDDVDMELTRSWPIIQGETPFALDYDDVKWCFPAMTYHHMPGEWVKRMWDYEQKVLEKRKKVEPIRHKHVFEALIEDELFEELHGWDNQSPDKHKDEEPEDVQGCRTLCEKDDGCLQYKFAPEGCTTMRAIKLGARKQFGEHTNITSGWMVERIQKFIKEEKHQKCDQKEKQWIKSNNR